jgi:hypothetical protein
MSRIYSIRDFLRLAPNYMLKQYMNDNNIEHDVDFEKLTTTKIEPFTTKEFVISKDSISRLNYNDENDLLLRQMIVDWGIENIVPQKKELKVA